MAQDSPAVETEAAASPDATNAGKKKLPSAAVRHADRDSPRARLPPNLTIDLPVVRRRHGKGHSLQVPWLEGP